MAGGVMYTVDGRRRVRALLLERARGDERIVGAAVTGSAARGTEDRWSDVDLLFGVAAGLEIADVVAGWSEFVYRELTALHHFDLRPGSSLYRAFLLEDLLEVDLGFTPAAEFGSVGDGGFQVVFGEVAPARAGAGDAGHLIGLAWHHVLHARTALERGAAWQAEYWISSLRDHTLELACLRLGHPASHAKGVDRLPAAILLPARESLVRSLEVDELTRALSVATRAFLRELRETDVALAGVLETPFAAIL